jgi:arylsulfatase A
VGNPSWGTFPASAESQTLAVQLQRAGYATAVAGKWQLTLLKNDLEQPHRLGFDTYCLFGWHEGPRYHQPYLWQDGQLRKDVTHRYGPDVYTDFLIEFMESQTDRPFLAFYSMALCHAVSDDFDPPPPYGPQERYDTFEEMVVAMDQQVGKLLAALARLELAKNTLVLFTADNGSPASNFLRHDGSGFISEEVVSTSEGRTVKGAKGKLSDWGLRVPTVARWAGVTTPGTTASALIDFSDFLPTFCELARAPLPDVPLDGRSFAAVLRGQDTNTRGWIFSQSRDNYCIRTQKWKLTGEGKLSVVGDDPFTERLVVSDSSTSTSDAARKELQAQMNRILDP